jgi:phage protein U
MANDSGNLPTMMVLGDYIFSLNTLVFQEWARTTEWKWPAQERMGQLAAKQFTGRGEDALELPGVIYPDFAGDIQSLDELRAMANDGLPYDLTDSLGFYQGRWVINRLDEKQTHHKTDGTPRKVEFTLRLSIFDDGTTADDGSSVLDKASGLVTAATTATGTTSAATALGSLKAAAAQVQTVVGPVLAEANSAIGALNRSISVVNDLRSTAANVAAQVQSIGNIGAVLSGSKTLLDKIEALGTGASSATRVIGNISLVAGSVPSSVSMALSSASNATTSVSSLLDSTKTAASSLLAKFS